MTHKAAAILYDLQRMVLLLDAAQDALDQAAIAEKRHEQGKKLRQVTAQSRSIATRELVAEMAAKYDIDLGA
jgi:hypothetical protein